MSPVEFPVGQFHSEAEDPKHGISCLSSSRCRPSVTAERSGYLLPKTDGHLVSCPAYDADQQTSTYSLNGSIQQPEDYIEWSALPEPAFSPYANENPDVNYAFPMHNHNEVEDVHASYNLHLRPRVIFNPSLEESTYEYPAELYSQDRYAFSGYGEQQQQQQQQQQHQVSRLSLSQSPPRHQGYMNSQFSGQYASPSILSHFGYAPSGDDGGGGDGGGDGVSFGGLKEQKAYKKGSASEPYAKLIWRALMTKESKAMVLKDIYKWFEGNTDKTGGPAEGWKNSIRHNLSMNGAFQKREREPGSSRGKKSCEWVLEPSAISDGVRSTTRFRKATTKRQQSKKRKLRNRIDSDLFLGHGGRRSMFGSTGSSGINRTGGRAYSTATLRNMKAHDQGFGGLDSLRGLSKYPPSPLPNLIFYPKLASQDIGTDAGGDLFSVGGDCTEIFEMAASMDGHPTPGGFVASPLGEATQVCGNDPLPYFEDDEGEKGVLYGV